MATIEQNIEKLQEIFEEIGKAVNEKYIASYLRPPYISPKECHDCKNATTPEQLVDLIKNIPINVNLDKDWFNTEVIVEY